jgi:exopolyphosphatase/pppGpp-phosphohydrolase
MTPLKATPKYLQHRSGLGGHGGKQLTLDSIEKACHALLPFRICHGVLNAPNVQSSGTAAERDAENEHDKQSS